MAKYRRERINEEVMHTLGDAIRTVKDPRVAGKLITITACRVTGDLKYAKVFFSVMGDEDIKEIKKGLYSAAGVLRRAIAEELNLRITPELTFEYDESMERGARIEELLKLAKVDEIVLDGDGGDNESQ
ncbi:MAG: 30S ribosome-binding factor RbfA [Clostridia bacterium]|nr:30S ribosome-binding factor RbfA [Clostridia bacterium]